MLNSICRPAASPARARLFRVAAPWACAWMLAAPVAHAAETLSMPMDKAAPPPFGHYQNWRDEPLRDWRESNDRVGEIGGWLTYLRESQQDGGGADSGSQGHHDHHGH
jgi:hypothetical protein